MIDYLKQRKYQTLFCTVYCLQENAQDKAVVAFQFSLLTAAN